MSQEASSTRARLTYARKMENNATGISYSGTHLRRYVVIVIFE